jgi:hypothetical protein
MYSCEYYESSCCDWSTVILFVGQDNFQGVARKDDVEKRHVDTRHDHREFLACGIPQGEGREAETTSLLINLDLSVVDRRLSPDPGGEPEAGLP